jgi:hypothetical protein
MKRVMAALALLVTVMSTSCSVLESETIPEPTLTTDESKMLVRDLLENNAGCRLPCWWGIAPGKTSWQETETLLRHLGATIFPFQMESGENRYAVRLLGLPQLDLSFLENKVPSSGVNRIFVGGNKGGGQDQREFEFFWESYSPIEIMSKYGAPSRILLDTLGTLGNTDIGKHGYTLWIFYDSLGFMIRYSGLIADEETFKFCFNLNQGANDIHHIELTLQHQDYVFPLEHGDSILGSASPRGLPLQDVTGISIEEVHQLFTQVEKPYCLETPHDVWPTR